MNESLDDDNIIFNKENIPNIITITKERDNKNNTQENIIFINKGKNKIRLNIDNKKQKINKEEIMKSLKKIIQNPKLNENYSDISKSLKNFKNLKNLEENEKETK